MFCSLRLLAVINVITRVVVNNVPFYVTFKIIVINFGLFFMYVAVVYFA